jgi:hypothetical protein
MAKDFNSRKPRLDLNPHFPEVYVYLASGLTGLLKTNHLAPRGSFRPKAFTYSLFLFPRLFRRYPRVSRPFILGSVRYSAR